MLKKMRWRVILAAMLAFGAVIALLAVLVNVVNYYAVTGRVDQMLSGILDHERRVYEGADPEPPPMVLPDLESNYMMRFFTVRFDSEDQVKSLSTDQVAAIDEADAVQYAK